MLYSPCFFELRRIEFALLDLINVLSILVIKLPLTLFFMRVSTDITLSNSDLKSNHSQKTNKSGALAVRYSWVRC